MRKTPLLVAPVAAGVLIVALAASALAWSGPVTDGAPSLTDASPAGYYLWHDDGFHLRTHGPGAEHRFTAYLTTDGTFADVDRVRLEQAQDDEARVVAGGHALVLRFHTYDAFDGVDFRIDGGSQLTLDLNLDGQPISTSGVFLGDDGDHPASNPFTLTR